MDWWLLFWPASFLLSLWACETLWPLISKVPSLPIRPPSQRVRELWKFIPLDAALRVLIVLWPLMSSSAPLTPHIAVVGALATGFLTLATMFFVHWMQHRVAWLRPYHAVHHQWAGESTSTDALQAFHEHPVDLGLEVLATLLAAFPVAWMIGGGGVVLTLTLTCWTMGLRTVTAIITHARVEQKQHHGLHHLYPYKNYSSLGVLDFLAGTLYVGGKEGSDF